MAQNEEPHFTIEEIRNIHDIFPIENIHREISYDSNPLLDVLDRILDDEHDLELPEIQDLEYILNDITTPETNIGDGQENPSLDIGNGEYSIVQQNLYNLIQIYFDEINIDLINPSPESLTSWTGINIVSPPELNAPLPPSPALESPTQSPTNPESPEDSQDAQDSEAPPPPASQVWRAAIDPQGRQYYWNLGTREVSWTLPIGSFEMPNPDDVFWEPVSSKLDNKTFEEFVETKRMSKALRKKYTEEPVCSICQEDINSRQNCSILKCDHLYHKKCIKKWLTKSCEKPTCPCCRVDVRDPRPISM